METLSKKQAQVKTSITSLFPQRDSRVKTVLMLYRDEFRRREERGAGKGSVFNGQRHEVVQRAIHANPVVQRRRRLEQRGLQGDFAASSPELPIQRRADLAATISVYRQFLKSKEEEEKAAVVTPALQPQLQISQPDDPAEVEADNVSEQIMRMPDTSVYGNKAQTLVRRHSRNTVSSKQSDSVVKPRQQAATPVISETIESKIQALNGKGESLPDKTRSEFEGKFGHGFENVRVHTDSDSQTMARAINAKAFTSGNHIVFGEGQYNPESREGQRLLAHELTHVVQQNPHAIQRKVSTQDPQTVTETRANELQAETVDIVQASQPAVPQAGPGQQTPPAIGNGAGNDTKTEADNAGQQPDTVPSFGSNETRTATTPAASSSTPVSGTSERAINMAVPALDGGPERMQLKTEASQGEITSNLLERSAAAIDQKINTINSLSANETARESLAAKSTQIEQAVAEKSEDKAAEANASQVTRVDNAPEPRTAVADTKESVGRNLESVMPKKLEDIEDFLEKNQAESVGQNVANVVRGEARKVDATYKEIENTPAPTAPRQPTPIGQIERPLETAPLELGQDTVPETTKEQTDFSEFTNESDNLLAKEGIKEEQLNMVTDGDLAEANQNRVTLQSTVQDAPNAVKAVEQQEQQTLANEMRAEEQTTRTRMRSQRVQMLDQSRTEQVRAKSRMEILREQVTAKINGMYEKANTTVTSKLQKLETESLAEFDRSQTQATREFETNIDLRVKAFKKIRYKGFLGKGRWVKDLFLGIDEFPEIKEIFDSEKAAYVNKIDTAIKTIMAESENTIRECKQVVAQARKDIDSYVAGLGPALRSAGQNARSTIAGKLQALDQQVNDAAASLKKKLQEKREAAIKAIDKKIEAMKASMSGLLNQLGSLLLDALLKFFKWVLKAAGYNPEQIMEILNKGKVVITKIVSDPKGFFANLGKGVGNGFTNFSKNIKQHLIKGLVGWLTGTLGEAGLDLPQKWDLKGVIQFFMGVMGLTWNFFRTRLVKFVGEPIVSAAEQGFTLIKQIVTDGPIALWNFLKEKAMEIKQSVMDGIKNWIVTTIVKKAVTTLLSMLNPAGALVQIILTLYNTVMFFVNNWQRIVELVKTIFGTIADVAMGNLGKVSKMVENAMAMTIPIIISFLARLLRLSGLAKAIQGIIEKVRAPIVKIMDKAAQWIAKKILPIYGKMKGALAKVGDKGKALVGNIIGWWKSKKQFQAKDGETHKLYFRGSGDNATLMIASDPETFESFIRSVETKDDKSRQAKAKAIKIAKKIDSRKQDLVKGSTDAQVKKNEKKKKEDIENLLNELSKHTKYLFVVDGAELPVSNIDYESKSFNGGVLGTKMTATVLSKIGPEGSIPTETNSIYKKLLLRREGGRSYYVRGHLLNHNIHGPGILKNLTPLSQTGNRYHLHKAEKAVKEAVDSGDVVKYEVTPNYDENRTDLKMVTNKDLEKIDSSKWEDIKKIRSVEKYVPRSLTVGAWKLEKQQNGKWEPKETLVSPGPIDNPVGPDLAEYEVGKGKKKRNQVSLVSSSIDEISENTDIIVDHVEKIKDAALEIVNLTRYKQISDKIDERKDISTKKKTDLKKKVEKLNDLKNVVLK